MTTEFNKPIQNLKLFYELIELVTPIQNDRLATVFIRFSGHVMGVEVDICEGSWTENTDFSFTRMFYLNHNNQQNLIDLKTYIKSLYEQINK